MGRLRTYFRPQGVNLSSAARLACFPTGESPVVRFSPPKAAFILAHPRAPYFASAAILYTSRGRSPQPACKAKPITGRTLGAQGRQARRRHQPSPAGRQPSGIQVSAESLTKAHNLKCRTQQKSTSHQTSAFSVNQQLPILPGRFQPSTFGVCELNYRVRHGYGCILTAIATESLRVCSLKTA